MRIFVCAGLVTNVVIGQQIGLAPLPIPLNTYLAHYIINRCEDMVVTENNESRLLSARTVALRTIMACKRVNKQWHEYLCSFFPEKDKKQEKIIIEQIEQVIINPEQPIELYTSFFFTVKEQLGISPKMVVALRLENITPALVRKEDDETFSFKEFLGNCLDWAIVARKHILVHHFLDATKYPTLIGLIKEEKPEYKPALILAIEQDDEVSVGILLKAGACITCKWQDLAEEVFTPSIVSQQKNNANIIKMIDNGFNEQTKKARHDSHGS